MEASTATTERRDRVATLAVFLGVTFGAMALVSLPVIRFLPAPIRNLLPFQGAFEDSFLSPDRGLTPSQAAAVGAVIDRVTGGSDGTTSLGDGVAVALADGSGSPAGEDSGGAAAAPTRGGNRFTGVHHDAPQPAPKGRDGVTGPRDRTPDEPAPDDGRGGPARGDDGGDHGNGKGKKADDDHGDGKAKGKDKKDDDGKDEGKGKAKGKGKGKDKGKDKGKH
jgi:hypothetical protein